VKQYITEKENEGVIEKENEGILKGRNKEDGTIEYELRYYNGGGFVECLEEAFNKPDV